MPRPAKTKVRKRKRSCLGCLGWTLFVLIVLPAVLVGAGFAYLHFYPPFGSRPTAKVLLAGLDEPAPGIKHASRRSDTIILCAARLHTHAATLISVPRDARVHLPHQRTMLKINAAYAMGQVALLRRTLAEPEVLRDVLPYYLVMDSQTVSSMVDALGGVTVDVPNAMDYDDNWGQLHIHLTPGRQRLNGEQTVGYLRWRKNSTGHLYSDDFKRTARQRALLVGLAQRVHTWDGIRALPAVYQAFQRHSWTNMTLLQLAMLAYAFQHVQTAVVPGVPATIQRVSFIECDWAQGRKLWKQAVR